MPPLNSKATRAIVKDKNRIEGPRSLHRGIHYTENEKFAASYKGNTSKQRHDHKDLLVHHQKINAELQDVYARTAALHAPEATMEQRIEASWERFEAIGGKRPVGATRRDAQQSVLCTGRSAVPYAARLATVAAAKKDLRARSNWERETAGEAVDYSQRGALAELKTKRVKDFQRRQLKRAHLLRRVGNPEPLTQSGHYDKDSGTFRVFNKTIRQVQREAAAEEKVHSVRERRKGSRSQWDVTSAGNINRPDKAVLSYSRDWDFAPQRKSKKRPRS
ncbi:hypothetical protein STCU_04303 [Strigomonas culicis]|uniref:Uncharacterized protein n=1 Tax=Strigomonas culicis TaxID=28005 RepID=S9W2B5_9TRYP|nr:hypothetical protein STCU_04303 [Strigomonas culicis]|eukprot:EPY29965.1 hypothetical protein STCU_04303 [Strigomonas culicis]